MNNEELKKKIVEILFPVLKGSRISCNEENACKQCWFPCEVDRLADSLADALIAAGMGDLKEHRIFAGKDGSIKQLYSGEEVEKIVKEREEYKHRAERAERAFSKLVHEMYEHGIRPMCDEKFFTESRLKEAEKELAEERNVKN